SRLFMERMRVDIPPALSRSIERLEAGGPPFVLCGWSHGPADRWACQGCIVFTETLRSQALHAVAELGRMSVHAEALTGDRPRAGATIGKQLGMAVQGGQLPQDKLRRVQDVRDTWGPVAFVGDGLNDAPALNAADVGIAMGCGADLTRESA